MEMQFEETIWEPTSPSSQYLNSSTLSLSIICVLETKVPIEIEDSRVFTLLKDVYLPINPRFSSIMVTEKDGERKWKRVEVNIEDHVKTLEFPGGQPLSFYDEYFSNYLSKLASDPFIENRPMWELHLLKFQTSKAAGNVIFRLHHSLGDGYSLMGALLSCLQRADNPSLPLTFPSRKRSGANSEFQDDRYTILNTSIQDRAVNIVKRVPRALMTMVSTLQDFGRSVLKSTLIEDDRTPIRSGHDGVEFQPIEIVTTTFSLDSIKQIKDKLNVTLNDVITGVVIYGTRLYMQGVNKETSNGKCTALVLFNTRAIGGYKSVSDMVKPNSEMPWGNHFTFLPVPLPQLTSNDSMDPLGFVVKARSIIKRQRNSASVFLTSRLLEILRKVEGPEATAKYIHATLKHTSMGITNLIGPLEEMSLANHPIKGLYFVVAGAPQSLSVTMVSYVDKLRVAIVVEKDFIDPNKLKSCIEYSFETIFNAAIKSSSIVKI
ncbi:wax ester synthase/diacylglycerol acyltransferase 4-like [Capsicum annuum]|uniref:wax ester synthase/diacylglycerol acyltransferase 4-like n=1 Tax=Capsicum annuum TaxID=4072 RepID=UPI001FB18E07|nr:wax ester synthase/diacylglycerol acyltransferase 4-like [Capsicum annuum]